VQLTGTSRSRSAAAVDPRPSFSRCYPRSRPAVGRSVILGRAMRRASLVFVGLLGIGLLGTPRAEAVQASGSIVLVPSKDSVVEREEFTVDVLVRNTSTATPGTANPATLHGPIFLDLSLVGCAGPASPRELEFIPGAADGCEAKAGGVTGCVDGAPDQVLINLDPAGLSLPATDAAAPLATVRLKSARTIGVLGLRASTSACALESCISSDPPSNCALSAVTGITFVTGIAPRSPGCERQCKAAIVFRESGADELRARGILRASSSVDPGVDALSIRLEVNGGAILDISIPPGGLQKTRKGFEATNGANFDLVRVSPRRNSELFVEIRASGNLRDAKSFMPLHLTLGESRFDFVVDWQPRPAGGWKAQF
jgi:hypothetical protein